MKHAEQVTFGGSALNRAAELRGDKGAISAAVAEGSAKTLLLWRGKPLVRAGALDALVRLAADHPLAETEAGPMVLLGQEEDDTRIFARELLDWVPQGLDASGFDSFVDQSEQQHPGLPEDSVFAELRRIMARLSPRDAELAATAKAVLGWHQSHRFCARCGAESEMAMSGWQRSCPACGGQHFPRTDPVVIMLITRGNSVLMGRSHGWPEGMYSLLAGFVEPGETLEAAVRREVVEEAGINVGQVDYLASQPWAFPSSLMFGCRGEALNEEIQIDPEEIDDAMWVRREEMMAVYTGLHPRMKPSREGSIAHFLLRNWLADTLD